MPGDEAQRGAVLRLIRWGRRALGIEGEFADVVRDAGITLGLKVVGTLLAFLTSVLIARYLGASGAGLYFLALTTTTIVSVVSKVGLEVAVVRYAAVHAGRNERAVAWDLIRKTTFLVGGASFATTVVLVGASPSLANRVFEQPALLAPMALMAIAIVPLNLGTVAAEALRGLGSILRWGFARNTAMPLFLVLLIPVLAPRFGVMGAVGAYLASTVLMMLLARWWLHREVPGSERGGGHFETRVLLATGMPLLWFSIMQQVMKWTDTLLLGALADASTVGIYSLAMRTAQLTSFILVALNTVAAPRFATQYAQGDMEGIQRLARRSSLLMFLASTPLLLLFLVAPRFVLGFYGPEFTAGAGALMVLALGQFINAASGPVGYLLIMTGHERILQANTTIFAIINLVLNYALILQLGMVGAAIATATSVALMNITSIAIVRWRLGIWVVGFRKAP